MCTWFIIAYTCSVYAHILSCGTDLCTTCTVAILCSTANKRQYSLCQFRFMLVVLTIVNCVACFPMKMCFCGVTLHKELLFEWFSSFSLHTYYSSSGSLTLPTWSWVCLNLRKNQKKKNIWQWRKKNNWNCQWKLTYCFHSVGCAVLKGFLWDLALPQVVPEKHTERIKGIFD